VPVVLIGDSGVGTFLFPLLPALVTTDRSIVGKSNLLSRFTRNEFR